MNLYKHHSAPDQLKLFVEAKHHVPELIWEKYKDSPEIKKYKDVLAKDPKYSYKYASHVVKGRFSEGEKAIATSAQYSHWYAEEVIKGRWPEGEQVIATSALYSSVYAEYVIKGRFPEGEQVIATDAPMSFAYALNIIGGRFPEGEKVMLLNPTYRQRYSEFIKVKELNFNNHV